MPRNRERHIQKEKDKGIIEMAAEQFAVLLWKQLFYLKNRKHKNISVPIVDRPLENTAFERRCK